jgi:hypothetical protein
MHDDVAADQESDRESDWEPYLRRLRDSGLFEGGSAIGDGICVRKAGATPAITAYLAGYIRVNAESIDHAKPLLSGNPHFRSGRYRGNTRVAADGLTSCGRIGAR